MNSAAPPEPAANSRSPCAPSNQPALWAEPPKLTSERVSSLVDAILVERLRAALGWGTGGGLCNGLGLGATFGAASCLAGRASPGKSGAVGQCGSEGEGQGFGGGLEESPARALSLPAGLGRQLGRELVGPRLFTFAAGLIQKTFCPGRVEEIHQGRLFSARLWKVLSGCPFRREGRRLIRGKGGFWQRRRGSQGRPFTQGCKHGGQGCLVLFCHAGDNATSGLALMKAPGPACRRQTSGAEQERGVETATNTRQWWQNECTNNAASLGHVMTGLLESQREPVKMPMHDSNKVGMDATHLPDQGYGRMCLSLPVDSERPCGCQAKREANTFKSVSMK